MSDPTTQPIVRPKPPAQLRRSTNAVKPVNAEKGKDSQSPPPPYQITSESLDNIVPLHRRNLSMCSVSSNVDPSLTLTAQMLGVDLDASTDREYNKDLDEEYIRNKSKEELEKLLLKAESVIRAREKGQ